MPNTLKNVQPGSLLRAPGPYIVRVPGTDFGGIHDSTGAAVIGTPLTLAGSYLCNISSDGFSADLRIPVCPVVVAAANADTWTLDVEGINHLGDKVRETWTKVSAASAQVSRLSMHCYSRITSIIPRAASTIGNRLRIGHCFGQRTFSVSDLAGRTAATVVPGISRRLPLPYRPKSASDVQVRYIGTQPGVATVLTTVPVTTNVAYTATTATLSVALGVATGLIGDVVYTADGYAGALTADATVTVFTCAGGFYKNGVGGTPANTTGAAAMYNSFTIVRNNRIVVYDPAQGGLIPGGRVMPLAGTGGAATEIAGVDTTFQSGTFGYLPNDPAETPFTSLFEVTVKVGAEF